jgi:hypothetical protein
MKSRSFITARRIATTFAFAVAFASSAYAQRLAILTPNDTPGDREFAKLLSDAFPSSMKVLDAGEVATAFRTVRIDNVFNMTTAEAKSAATVIGCDNFLLIRTGRLRRTSTARPEYYEAFAAIYLVSGRSGMLHHWQLKSFEANSQSTANEMLNASVSSVARKFADQIDAISVDASRTNIEEVPYDDSPLAKGLKPPVPYKRLKPVYTELAFLYDIRATVDVEADIALDGSILATRVVRWVGFGLDESALKAVREMNWRPAMRNGTPLAMRVLLRYNFTKVEKD